MFQMEPRGRNLSAYNAGTEFPNQRSDRNLLQSGLYVSPHASEEGILFWVTVTRGRAATQREE